MAGEEKRRHKRARAQGMAAYLLVDGNMTSAILENISAGGLFFRMPKRVPTGTPVTVRLVQPGLKSAVELNGVVVNYVSPAAALARGISSGLGVQFDAIPAEQVDRFSKLLARLGLPPLMPEQLEPTSLEPGELVPVEPEPAALDPSALEPVALEPLAVEPVALEPGALQAVQAGVPPMPGELATGDTVAPAQHPYFEDALAAQAAPAAEPSQRKGSDGLVDYQVHDAALRVEVMPGARPKPAEASVTAQEAPAPVFEPLSKEALESGPLSFEVQVPKRKKRASVSEVDRLMEHVSQLMEQLTEANERAHQSERQVVKLKQELENTRLELYQVKMQLAKYEGG